MSTTTSNRPLRIAIGDEPPMCQSYQEWLPSLGHQIVAVANTGRELIEQSLLHRPDLVITEINLPGMDGILVSMEVNRDRNHQVPVILVSANQDAQILSQATMDHIMGYLTKPIRPVDLAAAIHFARLRFELYLKALQQTETLSQALADRKIIERAKGVLMHRAQLDEEGAFRRMQQLATEKNRKLVDLARDILIAEEAYRRPTPPAP